MVLIPVFMHNALKGIEFIKNPERGLKIKKIIFMEQYLYGILKIKFI